MNEEASQRYAIIRQEIKQTSSSWENLNNNQLNELNDIIQIWKRASLDESQGGGNHGPSQFNLGLMYREGRGVKKSNSKAALYYEKAANQNIPKAQFNLARLYHQGIYLYFCETSLSTVESCLFGV